jgi:hypothetical protein
MQPYRFLFLILGAQHMLKPVAADQESISGVAFSVSTAAFSEDALTTTTSIWSASSTSTIWETPFGPNSYIDYITTQTVTQASSRGDFQSYPATVVDIGTTTVHYSEFAVETGGFTNSRVYSSTYVSSTTFIVYRPQKKDIPAGVKLNDVPCGPCAPVDWKSDQRCDALGLDTACQGQCLQQNGLWWCRRLQGIVEMGLNPEYQMGRTCWGNSSYYHQFQTPCVTGDHQFECLSCTVSFAFPTKDSSSSSKFALVVLLQTREALLLSDAIILSEIPHIFY